MSRTKGTAKQSQPFAGTVIVSTVGTSLLGNKAGQHVKEVLQRTANLRDSELSDADRQQIAQQVEYVKQLLQASAEDGARELSAELNGIVGGGYLGKDTKHYLLHTDTYQGKICAKLVARWLTPRVGQPKIVPLHGLSTISRDAFALGIDALLEWCDGELRRLREKHYRVVFNLTGGFKSFQAYAHTIGMLYADEICYIFEGPGSPLLRIPRLPIRVLTESVEEHAALFVRMEKGNENPPAERVEGIPEAFFSYREGKIVLSSWGKLILDQCLDDILARDLLEHPELEYAQSFRKDYERAIPQERVSLQETLAEVAVLYARNGLQALRAHRSLQYEDLENTAGNVGHFRVTGKLRVTCRPAQRRLEMLHFGGHEILSAH